MRRDQWLADSAASLVVFSCGEGLRLEEKQEKLWSSCSGYRHGRGRPADQDRRNKILEKLFQIALLRGEGWQWGEVAQALGKTEPAVKKLYARELSNLPEALAKEIAAHMERKPPRVGYTKAYKEALVKEIRAHNRRARLKQKPR